MSSIVRFMAASMTLVLGETVPVIRKERRSMTLVCVQYVKSGLNQASAPVGGIQRAGICKLVAAQGE
jgi:hypothetical protein